MRLMAYILYENAFIQIRMGVFCATLLQALS